MKTQTMNLSPDNGVNEPVYSWQTVGRILENGVTI